MRCPNISASNPFRDGQTKKAEFEHGRLVREDPVQASSERSRR